MAKGNLNPEITYYANDEIGILYEGLQKSNQAIRGYIEDIHYILGEMEKGNFTAQVEKEYLGDFILEIEIFWNFQYFYLENEVKCDRIELYDYVKEW